MKSLVLDVVQHADEKRKVDWYEDGSFVELTRYYGESFGIKVCGRHGDDGKFHPHYSFPFFKGTGTTSKETITVERHTDKDSFAGAVDDLRVGVTLIFYLQNAAEYIKSLKDKVSLEVRTPLTLSALASEGTILLPLKKDKEMVLAEKEISKNRANLIEAARNGDAEAMENLSMDEMDIYSMLSERIITEDVFTIVDSYFMPHGIECDQYSVLGEIKAFNYETNKKTSEEICRMTIESNDVTYDVLINRSDLLGEPAIGRRFKGHIWLQGEILFKSRLAV